jgi:Flp pilus assembly protein TadD
LPRPVRLLLRARPVLAAVAAAAALGTGVVGACSRGEPPPAPGAATGPVEPASAPAAARRYVGTARCAACHAAEAERWRGTHHDRAMQEATEATVLGDFGGARFEQDGAVTTFTKRDGRFFAKAEGPDGALHDYEIAYTFGVEPLQQYLVRFPDGRLQALAVAWDARPPERGGQRWFSLQPGARVPPGDPLHWTSLAYDWNSECAACHSTDLRKGYDPASDTFKTTWSDLDVGCEACHGPGAEHVARAEAAARAGGASAFHPPSNRDGASDDSAGLGALAMPLGRATPGRWVYADGAAIAHREPPRTEHVEIDTCAPCHSRRSQLREGATAGEPFLDAFRPMLLDEGLYQADGQVLDEDYVWGSFLQSRMYAAGVTCSDCHDPHALTLRSPGNATCARCHAPAVFDTTAHTHHAAGSPGAACVDCHMPLRTYMQVDARRDHSFRVPRPDLSVSLGVTNSCTDCHTDRSPRWAADAVAKWFPKGRSGRPHYATALSAGRRHEPGADAALVALARDADTAGIVRGTALSLLVAPAAPGARAALAAAVADADPLVRLGALEAAGRLPPPERVGLFAPLLRDPLRAVRVEAARALADAPADLWPGGDRSALADALAEYRAAQAVNAERPEAHANLGVLDERLGERDAARRQYETALRLAPWFVPAAVNLADLARAEGRTDESVAILRRSVAAVPDAAAAHYALGLALVRAGDRAGARASLERAAELAPAEPIYATTLAVALHDWGDPDRALATLVAARAQSPYDHDLLVALVTFSHEAGHRADALRYARALAAAYPDDPDAAALLASLEGGAAADGATRGRKP